jgi:DNA-binding Xre family transcriptional regulator
VAVAVKKSAKIKPYKFVDTKVAISKDSPESQKTLVKSLEKQQQSINNLGVTLNSIASVLKDFRDNQAKLVQLQADSGPKFEAKYTTRSGPVKKGGEAAEGTPSMSLPKIGFLESLMGFLKNTVGAAIGVAALDWLSDTNNQKAVKNTITLMVDVMKAIVGFVGAETKDFIDDMYTLLSDESTPLEKFGVVLERIGKFGVAFLAIRYLKNPLKIVNDLGAVLGFFNKNLLNSRNVLIRRASKIAALAAGALLLAKAFENKDEIKAGAEKATESTKEFLQTNEQVQQIKEVAKTTADVATSAVQSRSIGGAVPLRAGGGWIDGPQTGYPVSLDGGRSTAFIGHGREYVAQKANGGFVIPFDTPATRGNPNLTGLRMSQASSAGYDLGGMFGDKQSEKDQMMAMKENRTPKFAAGGEMPKFDFEKVGKKYRHPRGDKARDGTCTTGVLKTAEKHNVNFGSVSDYVTTGSDPNNPRGLMAQVIKNYGWGPLPGVGKGRSIRSPYGNVMSNSLTYSQWGEAVTKGLVPTGALVFSTTKGWDYSGGSSGNDSAIAQEGGKKLWSGYWQYDDQYKGKPIGSVYGASTKEVSVLTHPRGAKGSDTSITIPTTSALNLTGAAKERTTPEFIGKLTEMCKRLNCDPGDMLAKMASESGLYPNKSHSGGATGLIQFKPDTWSGLNTGKPFSWLRTASAVEQLPYIEKFLKPSFDKAPKGPNGKVSTGHVYVSTFLPAFAGDPEDTVIATKDGSGVQGFSASKVRGWYNGNAGLDGYDPTTGKVASPDGKITIRELAGRLAAKKKEFGISGGVTTGIASDNTQVAQDSNGNVIPPSGLQPPSSTPAITSANAMETFAAGLASFANALGADVDVDAFKKQFAGLAPGEVSSSASSGTSTAPGLSGNASNIGPVASGDSYASMLSKAPNPKKTMGDGSGSDSDHFRKSSGDGGGNGASKIKPSTVKPENISAPSSSGGGTASSALPAASGAAASAQQSMVQQTKVNIDSRPQREGTPAEILQRMAKATADANKRVQQLRSEGAQAVSDANRAAQPTHSVRTQKSGGESISLVDQLNSVNNILG